MVMQLSKKGCEISELKNIARDSDKADPFLSMLAFVDANVGPPRSNYETSGRLK
jgi:hypothetical protein